MRSVGVVRRRMGEAKKDLTAPEHTDARLLELLVCPLTKCALSYDAERQELISRTARLAYPIRNGVPIMTAEAARSLDKDPDELDQGSD